MNLLLGQVSFDLLLGQVWIYHPKAVVFCEHLFGHLDMDVRGYIFCLLLVWSDSDSLQPCPLSRSSRLSLQNFLHIFDRRHCLHSVCPPPQGSEAPPVPVLMSPKCDLPVQSDPLGVLRNASYNSNSHQLAEN